MKRGERKKERREAGGREGRIDIKRGRGNKNSEERREKERERRKQEEGKEELK